MREEELSESKRRVITLLQRDGEMTKRQLASQAHLGWATVVKVIGQLSDSGIVVSSGISEENIGKKGKNAVTFRLTGDRPVAIGVDIELRTTRIVLTTLSGEIRCEKSYSTPQPVDLPGSIDFLATSIRDFVGTNAISMSDVDGIGIAKAGVSFPTRWGTAELEVSTAIIEALREAFGTTVVRMEFSHKAYAVFEKWVNEKFESRDLFFVGVRSGVGTGIIIDGNLFRGGGGLSGEIGHMKVIPDGPPCRCGGKGCVEGVVNQHYLFEQYRTRVNPSAPTDTDDTGETRLQQGLADLFTRAKRGESEAYKIVEIAMRYLGRSIANAIDVIDVGNTIMSGYFGPDGDVIERILEDEIYRNILPRTDLKVTYVPFDPDGFVRGAALLVLKDYFVDVPAEGIVASVSRAAG